MAAKKTVEKEDLVNKYIQPSAGSNFTAESTSPFSKSTKYQENASGTNTGVDYTSKLENLLKQTKKQVEPTGYTTQEYTPSSSSFGDYLAPPTAPSFKKQTNSATSSSTTSYTTNYSSPTSANNYGSFSSSPTNAPKTEQKRMKKDDFEIGKKLGNGMFGEVFLVRHKTLKFVCAMKILKKEVVRTQKV